MHQLTAQPDVPWGFCSWAFVSDAVHERLQSGPPVIAAHEWNAGPHPWLIDVVAPFGDGDTLASAAIEPLTRGRTAHAWMPGPTGAPTVRVFAGNATARVGAHA